LTLQLKAKVPSAGLDRSRRHQEVEAPRILRQSAYEGGKVVSPTHRPPLPPMADPWNLFLLKNESTPRAIGHENLKDPIGNLTHDLPACSAVPQKSAITCATGSTYPFLLLIVCYCYILEQSDNEKVSLLSGVAMRLLMA
jgi:hypothetical protein